MAVGKKGEKKDLFTCAFYFTALQKGPKWTRAKGVGAHPECLLTAVELVDIRLCQLRNKGWGSHYADNTES